MIPQQQLDVLASVGGVSRFCDRLAQSACHPFTAGGIEVLQVNVGRRCNLQCRHCHVQAGPTRTEIMSRTTFDQCLDILRSHPIPAIDITGGAPEMNPHLDWFVAEAGKLGRRLIVRSNLIILLEPEYRRFLDIYARNGVEIVGSLPDCRGSKTEKQRGHESFGRCIAAMRELNARGYGRDESGLVFDIVHNPAGAYLPASQAALEAEYRVRLGRDHGVVFTRLFSLTNAPIGRYLEYLISSDNLSDYMADLADAYNPAAARNAMCRTTLSVGWDGTLYDCDFNQMLDLPVNHGAPAHISRFDIDKLSSREIVVGNHCYCCAAGAGSSCRGATASVPTPRHCPKPGSVRPQHVILSNCLG